MSRLTKLTPEQESLMAHVRDEWIAAALNEGDEVDMGAAARGIAWMYRLDNRKAPSRIFVADSPFAATMFARQLGADATNTHYWGLGYWSGWTAFYDYFARIGIPGVADHDGLQNLIGFLRSGVWDLLLFEDAAILSRRPQSVSKDSAGRLHSETGAAVLFRDGFGVWAIHGVTVDKKIVEDPKSITVAEIDSCANAEVRRVMLARFGEAQYLEQSNAELVHEDECGKLYRRTLGGDEALVMVRVLNSTSEPDGSIKPYFLRVPPNIKTARDAVAWTFGVSAKEYRPSVES